jgi:hypothetical protein
MAREPKNSPKTVTEAARQVVDTLRNESPELAAAITGENDIEEQYQNMDVFAYCYNKHIQNGQMIDFCIFRGNAQIATREYPYSWDELMNEFGPGHYQVRGRLVNTGVWAKGSETRLLADPRGSRGGGGSFRFGKADEESAEAQAPKSDPIAAMMLMIQQSNERAEQRATEQRERDEERRREEREREEARRRDEAANRQKMIELAITSLPTLLTTVAGVLKRPEPPRDPLLERLLLKLENQNPNQGVLDTKMLLELEQKARERENAARKEGREEMEKLFELAEERAETRAAEMIQNQGGDKNETVTEALIKGIAPALGALLMKGQVPPQIAEQPAPEAANDEAIPVEQTGTAEVVQTEGATVTPIRSEGTPQVPAVVKPKPGKTAARPVNVKKRNTLSPEDYDRKKVFDLLMPFFMDAFSRMSQGVQLTAEGAARESLEMLKLKGFSQSRVLELFTRQHFDAFVLKRLPEEYHSWFNKYYAALGVKSGNGSDAGSQEPSFTGAGSAVEPSPAGEVAGDAAPAGDAG